SKMILHPIHEPIGGSLRVRGDHVCHDSAEVAVREPQQLPADDPALSGLDDPRDVVHRYAPAWLVKPDQERFEDLDTASLHPVYGHLCRGKTAAGAGGRFGPRFV